MDVATTPNRFIAKGLSSVVSLRYFLVKILLCGAVQTNTVEEYAEEFRRFVVETVKALLGDVRDEGQYRYLDVEEALAQTESQRRLGQGVTWVYK